jgi:hypothetical protein
MTGLPVPTPYSWSVGDSFSAAIGNTVRDAIIFLAGPPDFVATQATAQSLANGAWTPVNLDTTQTDTYGGHSTTVNNSLYTCQLAGWYTVCGVAAITANGTAARGSRIQVNGNPIKGAAALWQPLSANDTAVPTPARDVYLNLNDTISVAAYQSSGAALNSAVDADLSSALFLRFSHA